MEDTASYTQLGKDVYVYGSACLALAMARETKMVHSLCTAEDSLTSTQIASQLNLKERYVRELLNSLTVAGLVQLEADTGGKEGQEARYWVPPTCRQTLEKVSTTSVIISASARKFGHVRNCFDLDGPHGVSYASDDFTAIQEYAIPLEDTIVEAILNTPHLKESLEKGLNALEVGCGTGWLFLRFAVMFPNSHFTLTDQKSEPLEQARKRAAAEGLTNVSFQILDICSERDDFKERFDWIATFNVIHDLPYPSIALQKIGQMLKPGGHYSLLDQFVSSYVAENVKYKDTVFLYMAGTFMCIPESYQQPDSEALGPCWGKEKGRELVEAAGLNVLGFTHSEGLGTIALCMCQKPE